MDTYQELLNFLPDLSLLSILLIVSLVFLSTVSIEDKRDFLGTLRGLDIKQGTAIFFCHFLDLLGLTILYFSGIRRWLSNLDKLFIILLLSSMPFFFEYFFRSLIYFLNGKHCLHLSESHNPSSLTSLRVYSSLSSSNLFPKTLLAINLIFPRRYQSGFLAQSFEALAMICLFWISTLMNDYSVKAYGNNLKSLGILLGQILLEELKFY